MDGDPRYVIRTLAYQLACLNPIFAEKIASQINAWPNITCSSFATQFRHLLLEPLSAFTGSDNSGPIVIILDALDECGTQKSRKEFLLEFTAGLAKLPSMFRVLVASRDEPDINFTLSRLHTDIRDIRIDDAAVMSDISQLFRRRLVRDGPAFMDYELASDWPGDRAIQQLAHLSGGLFIWASTTIRFIEDGIPDTRLKSVLQASAHGEPHEQLDQLYWVALTHPFNCSSPTELHAVRSILGAIVVAYDQLTDEQLSDLLEMELGTVRGILRRLQPLLHWVRGMPVRVLHTSFTDFVCERCQYAQWHINKSIIHNLLTSSCFRVMAQGLKFNVIGSKSSYYRHKDIERTQERVDMAITPTLLYASQHWVDHLESGTVSDPHTLADMLTCFMHSQLLHWVEVLSFKNRVSIMCAILKKAASWAKVTRFYHGIGKFSLISIGIDPPSWARGRHF